MERMMERMITWSLLTTTKITWVLQISAIGAMMASFRTIMSSSIIRILLVKEFIFLQQLLHLPFMKWILEGLRPSRKRSSTRTRLLRPQRILLLLDRKSLEGSNQWATKLDKSLFQRRINLVESSGLFFQSLILATWRMIGRPGGILLSGKPCSLKRVALWIESGWALLRNLTTWSSMSSRDLATTWKFGLNGSWLRFLIVGRSTRLC